MHGRRAPRAGMSYVDANLGRVVEVEDDVLGIKAQIQERWPSLRVYLDKDNFSAGHPPWIVTEVCLDGVERLIGEYEALDGRLIRRLELADQYARDSVDPCDLIDKLNDEVEKKMEAELIDKMGENNERLLHAMRKDGLTSRKVFIRDNPLLHAT